MAKLKTYGDRAYAVAAPKLWNKLPLDIRLSSSVTVFKTKLRAYLFTNSFDLYFLLLAWIVLNNVAFFKIFKLIKSYDIVKRHWVLVEYGTKKCILSFI